MKYSDDEKVAYKEFSNYIDRIYENSEEKEKYLEFEDMYQDFLYSFVSSNSKKIDDTLKKLEIDRNNEIYKLVEKNLYSCVIKRYQVVRDQNKTFSDFVSNITAATATTFCSCFIMTNPKMFSTIHGTSVILALILAFIFAIASMLFIYCIISPFVLLAVNKIFNNKKDAVRLNAEIVKLVLFICNKYNCNDLNQFYDTKDWIKYHFKTGWASVVISALILILFYWIYY